MEEFLYIEEDAMENGYNYLVGNATLNELIESSIMHVAFPFDPREVTLDDIEKMEKYFASTDNFERAIELRNIRNDYPKEQ
jgi:hypothetical protein